MPATRLTERQKAQLVERFRGGEAAQPLALAFGCSPNTVSRVVKAALDPAEYERLKEQRGRRPGPETQAPAVAAGTAHELADPLSAGEPLAGATPLPPQPETEAQADPPDDEEADDEEGPGMLAIDDADDFGDDDDDSLGDDEGEAPSLFVAVAPLLRQGEEQSEIVPLPLESADLRGSAYMLVDKTVELQPRPLSEFTELGRLPLEEMERRALMMFLNPREAKRLCGRTQRVIKIPDTTLLHRTAPYLLAQGISRVVIERSLFALPGS